MALVGERLSNELIKKPADVTALLMTLTPERVKVVCDKINNKLPEIIKDGEDFGLVLQHLTPGQCESVCTAMNDNLPKTIHNGWDFSRALGNLNPGQRTSVCTAIKDKLSDIIKDGGDFRLALQYLTPGQCESVCVAMKDTLPGIIKDGFDFGLALQDLTMAQCESVCTAIKDKLPDIIHNGYELKSFLENTNAEVQQHFFASGSADNLMAKIILNGNKEIPECHKILHTARVKNAFNQALFSGLLQELGAFTNKMSENKSIHQDGFERLKASSNDYFNAYPDNQGKLAIIFRRNCSSYINNIQTKLRGTEGLAPILDKILLAAPVKLKGKPVTCYYLGRFFNGFSKKENEHIKSLLNISFCTPDQPDNGTSTTPNQNRKQNSK